MGWAISDAVFGYDSTYSYPTVSRQFDNTYTGMAKNANGWWYIGKDGKVDFVETKAKLKSNNCVEVSIPKVEGKILELRYLYAFNPAPVNLYSAELIPAESFVYKF